MQDLLAAKREGRLGVFFGEINDGDRGGLTGADGQAHLGDGDRATELFSMLNPITHTRDAAGIQRYRAEPYVVAADLIGVPFVKADATKFSETGYVGGDVEDMVRDLVRLAGGDVRESRARLALDRGR